MIYFSSVLEFCTNEKQIWGLLCKLCCNAYPDTFSAVRTALLKCGVQYDLFLIRTALEIQVLQSMYKL